MVSKNVRINLQNLQMRPVFHPDWTYFYSFPSSSCFSFYVGCRLIIFGVTSHLCLIIVQYGPWTLLNLLIFCNLAYTICCCFFKFFCVLLLLFCFAWLWLWLCVCNVLQVSTPMPSSQAYAQGSISLQCFLQRQDLTCVWRDLYSTIDSFLSISVQPRGPEGQDSAKQMHQNPRPPALRHRLGFDQLRLAHIRLALGL